MHKINTLLQELCPEGVEFKPIGDVVKKTKNIRWADNQDAEFKYIDLTSVDRATHSIVSTQIIDIDVAPSRAQQIVQEGDVIFGTTRPLLKRYAVIPQEYDGQICSTGFCVLRPDHNYVLTNYLFHLLGTDTFYQYVESNEQGTSYPAISDSAIKKFPIPIPPLPIQNEIVHILDLFTQLEAELEAELEARKTQYTYYRDALLNFEGKEVEWKTLGEVGEFVRGNGLQKKDFTESGVGCIHYGQIYTYYGTYTDKTKSFVSPELAKKLKKASKNDLIIAGVSENIDDVCKAVVWLGEEDICISGDAFIFKHKQNPKYMGYLLQTKRFLEFKKKYAQGAKVTRLQSGSLPKFTVPIPSLKEQARIANILDKLDTLINDISSGLPAEIQARRQQYEYYRNQLLTFKNRDHG